MFALGTKLRSSAVALATGGALMAGMGAISTANAGIQDLLFFDTLWQDVSFEKIEHDANSDGILDIGDTLRGVVRIDTASDQIGPTTGTTTDLGGIELTAIFETEVTGKTFNRTDGNGIDRYDFEFGPHVPFATEFGGLAAGALVVFFSDPTGEFFTTTANGCTTGAGNSCESFATGDAIELVLGHNGSDIDELWTATDAPEDATLPADFTEQTTLGSFKIDLSILTNNTGLEFNQVTVTNIGVGGGDNKIDVAASGDIKGSCSEEALLLSGGTASCGDPGFGEPTSSYDVIDNATFRLSAVAVPEPGMMGIFGLSLLGLGVMSSRRKKKA